ncbi:DEAD/DEAH box helicase [Aquibacillus rhizosphaerae]|uniref:DEAD/DEAH box helicase n=1 Tax=Aquibacillus rhizosphaerae TaxID=3051431 RepID=A0ABT7L0G9_9BACI|nr:DEAD/DEAH box helicase [Aquibacillus sp. LR5S19]MDL4839267.1 DEAD/DEAH box helicase [Aquibacillus sp. LR5S19]
MRTFFLDKQDIVRITGERFYKRGYNYFKQGRVHGLSYNPSINSWRGYVRGTESYSVRIFFFENDELEASCDCPAYATHFTCKHIAAVLLAIGQDSWNNLNTNKQAQLVPQKKATTVPNDTFTTRILDVFSNDKREFSSNKEQLEVEYIIGSRINPHNSMSFLEVELKIGIKKLYVIKNIREFLVHIKKAKTYALTAKFAYDPKYHEFSDNDKEIIKMILTAYENESLFENSFSNPLHDKRTIIIPPGMADNLIDNISAQAGFYKSYDGEVVAGVSLRDEIDHLDFKLDSQTEEHYNIDISALSEFTFLSSYGYLVKQGVFYRLTEEQHKIIDQLYALLPYRTKQTHDISRDKIESFITNVVPKLEKIGTVNYSEKTKDTITVAPLRAKVYVEEQKNALMAKVEFHYGNRIVRPYVDSSSNDSVIKRDISREMRILELLEKAEFVYLNKQFQLFKNDAIYTFINETIADLERLATVYVSDEVKTMIVEQKPELISNVNVDTNRGMLDIHFDIEGISQSDVQDVLQAMIEKKRYYRIPNGALLSLQGEAFESFYDLADQLQLNKNKIDQGHLQVPAARSFQIEDTLNSSSAQYSQSFRQLLTELKQPTELNFPLPDGIQAELRDYQFVGYQWLRTLSHYHLGGILADDMGLGKTLQTITYLLAEKQARDRKSPSIVVAPASLLYNWKKEFEKFAPSMTTKIIIGNKNQRRNLITEDNNDDVDVFITSYPLLRKDVDLYEKSHFDALILDEAQAIKNHLTQTAKAVRSISATQRFALSGTPIENSLDELWSLFYTISPGLFGNKKAFLNLDHAYISKITRPFILRRLKKDVLDELPDKIETVQYSDLTKNQKEVYMAYVDQMQQRITETIQEKGFEKGKLEILAGLTRLRQICCHPSLFLENYSGQSGKLEQLKELVEELKNSGKRALIFSQFSSMLKIINTSLQDEGYDTFYLDGSTPSEKRIDMVDAFNNGEKSVFLISLKAGGTGLNLTGADTVILYDLWWNPAVEEQAAGRAHRIGQKKVVQIIRMITEGTIEEKIYELQQKKRELVDQIIQPGETMLSKLSEKELRQLLEVQI